MALVRLFAGIFPLLFLCSTVIWGQDNAKDKNAKAEEKKDLKKAEEKKDEKKDEKKEEKKVKEKTPPGEKWIPGGNLTAIIREVRETDRSVVLSINEKTINPGALSQIQQAQMAMRFANSPQARIQAQRSLAQAQMTLYQDKATDIEFLMKDDVKIRQMNPPEAFDEKGRTKKYTAKELAELRGPEKGTKGFPADFGSLNAQLLVSVELASKAQKKGPGGYPAKAKSDDPILARELRPRISSIMIYGSVDNKK